MKKLVLIDSNALVHRAFHALPPLNSPQGVPTNAVYGFAAIMIKMLKDLQPDYVVAAFDLPGPTFRHEAFAEYKAHRVKAPDELYAQIPLVKEMLEAWGIPVFEKAGFEADDVIGSLAEQAKRQKDLQTIITTGDLDTLQLVEDDKVVVLTLKKGITDTIIYNEKEVKSRYNLRPDQVIDFKGLKGDPSDNIPGVPGVGDKTASILIDEFGSIEAMYKALESGKKNKKVSEKLQEKLLANKDMALFSKKLATIITDVPIILDLHKAEYQEKMDRTRLEVLMRQWGFTSLIKRLAETSLAAQSDLFAERPTPKTKTSKLEKALHKVQVAVDVQADGTILASLDDKEVLEVSQVQLRAFLADADNELVGYNVKSLLKEILKSGDPVRARVFDMQIADYLLRSDARGYEFEATYQVAIGALPQDKPRVAYFLKLKDVLVDKLKSEKLTKVFEEIEIPVMLVLARMELNGIKVDTVALEKLRLSTNKELAKLEKEIYKLAGGEFNINSPQQLGQVLYEKLGLKAKIKKTGGGAFSTAASELEKIRDLHPVGDLLLEYRELQKLKTTYIDPFPALIDSGDGRIHTTYVQTAAATGRLASRDPNLQNIPIKTELGREFRKAFVSPKGWELVSFDYSQLELRITAHLAQDEKMIDAFRTGQDIHTRTAVEIFKVAPEAVTKEMRRQAKVLNFGIIYGMGSNAFSRAAGLDRAAARDFIDRYMAEFSGVAAFMERTKQLAAKQGYVETMFGRRRYLPEIHSSMPFVRAQAERMAINHPAQGTEADLIKLAMIAIDGMLTDKKLNSSVRLLLQVHDELVFEVESESIVEVAPKIAQIMEQSVKLDVPLIVDVRRGRNWSDTEPLSITHARTS